jgi:hypothetical protein
MVSLPGRGFDPRQLHLHPPTLYAKAGFFFTTDARYLFIFTFMMC